MPTVTVTQKVEVKLSPLLKRKLKQRLDTYANLATQIEAAEHAQGKVKTEIEELFEQAGQGEVLRAGLAIDGVHLKRHEGEYSTRLDKKKLLEAGLTTTQIANAYTRTPKKGYMKIRLPNEKEESGDE